MALAHIARLLLAAVTISLIASSAQAGPSQAAAVLIRQPSSADTAAMDGVATLRVLARAGERVRQADLSSSSGNAAFDTAALRAVRRWRYIPALIGDSAEPEWLLVRMVYAHPAPYIRSARR